MDYTRAYNKFDVKDNVLFFESFFGSNMSDNPLALFKYLFERDTSKKYTYVWALQKFENNGYYDYYSKFSNVKFVKPHTDDYYRYLSSSKYIICNVTLPNYFIKKENQVYLNTWHGTPLKTLGKEMAGEITQNYNVQRNFFQTDYLLSQNSFTTDKLVYSYDIDGIYRGKVLESGYPRIDQIFGGFDMIVRDKALSVLNIDASKKTILYAPTWRGENNSVNDTVSDFIDKIKGIANQIDATKYQILIKVHPQMAQYMTDFGSDAVKIVPTWVDACELLGKVDVLITDYSSIFFDYLVTNKPIIFYMYDKEEYLQNRGVYFDFSKLPGSICTTESEVANQIMNFDQIIPNHKEIIDDFVQKFVSHDDGHVSKRVIDRLFNGQQSDAIKEESFNNGKPNVVLYSGALLNNGITSSIVNLSHSFDYSKYNLIIADKNVANDDFTFNARRIDKRAHIIYRGGGMDLTYGEWITYHRLFTHSIVQNVNKHRVFVKREWRRLLGDTQIDVGIEFSGYSPFWSYLMAFSDARKKVIFQHNDMKAEIEKVVQGKAVHEKTLSTIFSLYRYFTNIACVGNSTLQLNKQNLKQYTDADQFKFVPNLLNKDALFAHRKHAKLKQVELFGNQYLVDTDKPDFGRLDINGVSAMSKNGINFINIGRLSPEKAQDRLIRAFARFIRQVEGNHKLYIVGSGLDEQNLKSLALSFGLDDSVVFVGQTPHAMELLDAADCFVFSSTHEGQPMTLLECLALGKPIVATDIPGNRSVLDGTDATIVDDSEQGVLDGMMAYANNQVQVSNFSVDTYNENAKKVFAELIE